MAEVKATKKQKKAMELLAGNVGISVGEAMRQAGYSEITANTPQKLTESVAYKSLADEITAEEITKNHKDLFDLKREATLTFPKFMEDEEIIEACNEAGIQVLTVHPTDKNKIAIYFVPDGAAKAKAVEMAHKMKGAYLADKPQAPTQINFNLFQQPQFQVEVKGFEQKLRDLLANGESNVQTTQKSVEAQPVPTEGNPGGESR